jgi:hypothetical protein
MIKKLLGSRGAFAVLLVLLAWAGYRAWMDIEASGKITPDAAALAVRSSPVTLAVELPFPPEAFHVEKLQSFGRIRRVRGTTVQMAFADLEKANELARRFYWIDKIDIPPKN